jgi:hypothetical protein
MPPPPEETVGCCGDAEAVVEAPPAGEGLPLPEAHTVGAAECVAAVVASALPVAAGGVAVAEATGVPVGSAAEGVPQGEGGGESVPPPSVPLPCAEGEGPAGEGVAGGDPVAKVVTVAAPVGVALPWEGAPLPVGVPEAEAARVSKGEGVPVG